MQRQTSTGDRPGPGGTAKDGREKARRWHPAPPRADARILARSFRVKHQWRWLMIVMLAVFWQPVRSQETPAAGVSPGAMQSGSLLLRMRDGYTVATRMNTDVRMKISGLVARVSVRQEFRNDGSAWVEGIYVFPLSDRAAVDHLRMHIGERLIEGEIREKAEARKQYEQAKAQGHKASLVEQQRANMFTTSVANIGPGESVTIEIEYLETLRYDEGTFSLRFPVTITPRYIPGSPLPDRQGSGWSPDTTRVADASEITPPVVNTSRDHRLTMDIDLDAGVPLEIIASRYHPIDVREQPSHYSISLAEGRVPMDQDFELIWRPVPDAAARASLFTEVVDGQPHLLLMMLPPNDSAMPEVSRPREIIFVVDTSGSMHGVSITQAKEALDLALGRLRPQDRFNVIQFNSYTDALYHDSVPATSAAIDEARAYVQRLEANGGTEMRPALERALLSPASESHLRQIIFITDGSVGNEQELFSLIEVKLGHARLFTVGIGSAPNGWFMRKAAEAGRGTYTYISALHEVGERMARLFRKLESPQVTDLRIQWPSGVQVEAYPDPVADLYAGEPVVVSARLTNAPRKGAALHLSGNAPSGTWEKDLAISAGNDAPGVAALWARARIEDLLDRQRRGADAEATRAEVVKTAIAHHLVSRYTSLVAVDKTPARPRGAGLDREQVPNLLPYGQDQNAIFGFPGTATGAGLARLLGLISLLAALVIAIGRRQTRDLRFAD